MATENAWSCECGHVEYGAYPPEECTSCWKINSFVPSDDDEDLLED